jgi:hypothetical protein
MKLTLNEYRPGRGGIAVGDGFNLSLQTFRRQPRAADGGTHLGNALQSTLGCVFGEDYDHRGAQLDERLAEQAVQFASYGGRAVTRPCFHGALAGARRATGRGPNKLQETALFHKPAMEFAGEHYASEDRKSYTGEQVQLSYEAALSVVPGFPQASNQPGPRNAKIPL